MRCCWRCHRATVVAGVEAALQGIGGVTLVGRRAGGLRSNWRDGADADRPRSAAVPYPARDAHETGRLFGRAVARLAPAIVIGVALVVYVGTLLPGMAFDDWGEMQTVP